MLKNIPKIIPPELLKILCEMGQWRCGADRIFLSASMGQRVVYEHGLQVEGNTLYASIILKKWIVFYSGYG